MNHDQGSWYFWNSATTSSFESTHGFVLVWYGNKIGNVGARAIAKATRRCLNSTWAENYIGVDGVTAIANTVKINTSLHTLTFEINKKIGVKVATAIAEALKTNSTLQVLEFENNGQGDDGAKAFAEALRINSRLHRLSLYKNSIGDDGVRCLEILFDTPDINPLQQHDRKRWYNSHFRGIENQFDTTRT